jgi:hypothetical protein
VSKLRAFRAIAVASFSISSIAAATPDAFVGRWLWVPEVKGLNMEITSTATNRYDFHYMDGETEHVVADGQFHKGELSGGEQVSFQKTGDSEWTMKYKFDQPNPARGTSIFTLSKDGTTLTEKEERISAKGDQHRSEAVLTRSKPADGIVGEWAFKNYVSKEGPEATITITSAAPNQMTLANSDTKDVLAFASLDGKIYKESGPTASTADAYSVKLVDDHTLLFDRYKQDKLQESGKWTVSANGKTLTAVEKPNEKPSYTVSYSRR